MTTISFPTLTRSAPRVVQFGLRSYTQTMESPLTGSVQTIEIPFASRWMTSFTFTDLDESDTPLLQAFLLKLRGRANRAALWNFARPVPQGTIALSGVTTSGSTAQGATSVTLTGCGAGATVLSGDFFSVGGELKMAVADATANGSGVASVTFEPPVRAVSGWTGGSSVTLNKPTALFIQNGDEASWSTQPRLRTDVPLDMIEVFA